MSILSENLKKLLEKKEDFPQNLSKSLENYKKTELFLGEESFYHNCRVFLEGIKMISKENEGIFETYFEKISNLSDFSFQNNKIIGLEKDLKELKGENAEMTKKLTFLSSVYFCFIKYNKN